MITFKIEFGLNCKATVVRISPIPGSTAQYHVFDFENARFDFPEPWIFISDPKEGVLTYGFNPTYRVEANQIAACILAECNTRGWGFY